MPGSKKRPLWSELPTATRTMIENLVGGAVVGATNCPGGFSPGFASRLRLADGRRVFVKGMDAQAWPGEAETYRAEAAVSMSLSPAAPAPRHLGTSDDGGWVILAFEDVDGTEPEQPWRASDVDRVVVAVRDIARHAPPETLRRDHPRLGGWHEIAAEDGLRAALPRLGAWAASHLDTLLALEERGLAAAQGESIVHFDGYPHNIPLTPERVVFVDWPHARLGAPYVDLVLLLSSVAASGLDPERYVAAHAAQVPGHDIDAVLAAHAGFCAAGALWPAPPGLEPIVAAKTVLASASLGWLIGRLARW
jgi:Phosphotransferase enzyme family